MTLGHLAPSQKHQLLQIKLRRIDNPPKRMHPLTQIPQSQTPRPDIILNLRRSQWRHTTSDLRILEQTDAIKVLPKRKEALEMEDGKREFFWSLLLRERRSVPLVLAYVCLFNAPGVVFFLLRLFQWQHTSDLQNASVPVLTSLTLTIGFVGWLLQSRDESWR